MVEPCPTRTPKLSGEMVNRAGCHIGVGKQKTGGNNDEHEFYPTPRALLDKIFAGVKWSEIQTVLEPSAGKGDMASYIREQYRKTNYQDPDIDCIEKDPTLARILKGEGFPVIHDDFLTFHTGKQYDLIAMNPPFSNGDEHLLKALDLQKHGGYIICILNADNN